MLERQSDGLRTAPQRDYTSAEQLADEMHKVFDTDWVVVTREGALPNPGDYVAARLGAKPIMLVRQDDGSIKAFGNYCLHRYARLVEGSGNKRRFACPYHAWTYTMDGKLIGIADREGFCAIKPGDLTLEELDCDTALGFVFVSLTKQSARPSDRLRPLAEITAAYDIGAWADLHIVDTEIWDGNWKAVIENFIESYHTTYAHKRSIGPTNPTALAEQGPTGHDFFSIHSNSYRPEDLPEVHNPALTDEDRNKFHVIALYPNGLAAIDANFMWWMALEPIAPGRSNARWGLSFSPYAMNGMADADGYVAEVKRIIEIATEEDKEMVARVQDGAGFDSAIPGHLHDWLEVYVKEFQAYIAQKLADPA